MSTNSLKKNRFAVSGSQLLHNSLSSTDNTIPASKAEQKPQSHVLPDGHTLNINFEQSHISIDTPDGQPSVRIQLDPKGPIVEVAGARLTLSSPKDINIACENFSLEAQEDVYMNAQKSLIIESTQDLQINCEVDVHIRANVIWLN